MGKKRKRKKRSIAIDVKAIYQQGIPATSFATGDIQGEYERLEKKGVVFSVLPTETEGPTVAVFDDTCGNFIQLYQE